MPLLGWLYDRKNMLKLHLKYEANSADLFARIAHMPWAMWLDSGQPASGRGRFDIMVANPFCTIIADTHHTRVSENGQTTLSDEDPFDIIKQQLARFPHDAFELPFEGGALGYFAYDLGHRIEQYTRLQSASEIPEMQVGIYDWALVVDHELGQTCLISHLKHPQTAAQWEELCATVQAHEDKTSVEYSPLAVTGQVTSNMTATQYAEAFQAIQQFIHAGDCYQVNLAQRFRVAATGDAFSAYCKLRELSPAPFMAWMNVGQADKPIQILSASPERFLRVVGGAVETRPIKGTRPRHKDMQQDAKNARELQHSRKDQAENLMIVDLLRNDLGKVCQTGSVQVSELFTLESFTNVHHLVSTVRGKLAENMTAVDVLRACFPGGSITGAPKLRAMQIIESLEPDSRGVYCGAIGYIGFDGNMDMNIPIRTAVYQNQKFDFWAGGGIVADSEMEKEYKETWDKASAMLELIATLPQGAHAHR